MQLDWVFFSVLAALLFNFANILDKLVLEKWIKKPIVSALFFAFFEVLAGAFVLAYTGNFFSLSLPLLLVTLFVGFISFLATILYFEAAKVEEISRVIPFFYLTPIFVLIFGFIFLNERLSAANYVGVFFLVAGAFMITIKEKMHFKFERHYLYLIFATFLIAISTVITKYLLEEADFWTIFGYSRVGMIFLLLPLAFFNIKNIRFEMKKNSPKIIVPMFLSELFTFFAILLIFLAYSDGQATLVSALLSLQTLFLFIIMLFLSFFFPKLIKEDISSGVILQKTFAIFLMIAGTLLVI